MNKYDEEYEYAEDYVFDYTMESQYQSEYHITATNAQGAYCSGGVAKSLTAAIAKARRRFGKGWKIRIHQDDKVIKEWLIRK